jgi:hypothetical protein
MKGKSARGQLFKHSLFCNQCHSTVPKQSNSLRNLVIVIVVLVEIDIQGPAVRGLNIAKKMENSKSTQQTRLAICYTRIGAFTLGRGTLSTLSLSLSLSVPPSLPRLHTHTHTHTHSLSLSLSLSHSRLVSSRLVSFSLPSS